MSRVRIIGIGTENRGDDVVGLEVARTLKEQLPTSVSVCKHSRDLLGILDSWENDDSVILVDAVSSNKKAGSIHSFEVPKENIPETLFRYSTHTFSIREMVELGKALGRLPRRMRVYGVEGKRFRMGDSLSHEVEAVIPQLTQQIASELAEF